MHMKDFLLIERNVACTIGGGKSEDENFARELGRMFGSIVRTIITIVSKKSKKTSLAVS